MSSNLATNLLMDRLGVENIRAGVHALGGDGMNVRRDPEDGKAFAKGPVPSSSPRSPASSIVPRNECPRSAGAAIARWRALPLSANVCSLLQTVQNKWYQARSGDGVIRS